ncbi:hypothetical protein R75483_02588 [Paraburkholderia domus]|nr:hypothetical protein R75483_02588 [Paraburkholderia domus]
MTFAQLIARCSWLAFALISGVAMADTACDKQPVKADRMQAIGRDMIVNGVPTSVWGLEFAGSPSDVSNEFREFWTNEGVPAKGKRGPSGWLLSALDDTCHYVLTIPPQPDGAKTKGLLSVMQLSGQAVRHRIPDSVVPFPEGGKIISDVESRDPGQAGRTWLVEMSGRASDNAQRYSTKLSDEGWSTVTQAPAYRLDGSQRIMGNAMVMQRGSDRLDVIFSDRNGQTEAVINAARNR